MKTKLYEFFFLCLLICVSGCKTPPGAEVVYRIKFSNSTNNKLYLYSSFHYPDTLLPEQKPVLTFVGSNNYGYIDSEIKWENVFEDLPNDTLIIFVINADTLNKYSWQGIAEKYLIEKRFELSYEDLNRNSFSLNYP